MIHSAREHDIAHHASDEAFMQPVRGAPLAGTVGARGAALSGSSEQQLVFEHRESASPCVERVWRSRSLAPEGMISIARAEWDLVFWETPDGIGAGVRGPETIATKAPVPEHAEFLGIRFTLGTLLSDRPASMLVDRFFDLPRTASRRFVVDGLRLRMPEYDNAEDLVDRLVRAGRITHAPLERATGAVTTRTQERRFAAATGMTRGAVRQITRAQHAATQLQAGTSPLAVVHDLGYFDQPHLARSLRRFVGATATELASGATSRPLSLLYKTEPGSEP
jgi:hypothetical protein